MRDRDERSTSPQTIDYATPDQRERPTVALWVAAGLIWAGTATLAFVAVRFAGRDALGTAILLAIAGGVAWVEWDAVVKRSHLSAGFIAVPAGFFALVAWGGVAVAAEGVLRSDDRSLRAVGELVQWAGLALVVSVVAGSHARWAWRLRRAAILEALSSITRDRDA